MHFVTLERHALRHGLSGDLDQDLVAAQNGLRLEQAEPFDAAGWSFDAFGIGDAPAEHLIAAAEAQHVATAAEMRREVDVPMRKKRSPLALEMPLEEGGAQFSDILPDLREGNVVTVDTQIFRNRLTEIMETFPVRDREVIRMMFGLDMPAPMTLIETGRILGVCKETVRHIKCKALRALKDLMPEFEELADTI